MGLTLVTGAGGQLGRELHGDGFLGLDHTALDVTDPGALMRVFKEHRPDAVIHCAAWTDVDGCTRDPVRAHEVNAVGTQHVVDAARRNGTYVVYVSTDYVFDGHKTDPYTETDMARPLSVYGATKYAGEIIAGDDAAIVRTSWICGVHGHNLVRSVLDAQGPLRFVTDQRAHPTLAVDLADKLRWFVAERPTGIWHVTNQGAVTAYEFARATLEIAGEDPDRVEPITSAELNRAAARPANSVLANARLEAAREPLLPDWRESLEKLLRR